MAQGLSNFKGKENLQRILYLAELSNKYDSTIKVFSHIQGLLLLTSNTLFLQDIGKVSYNKALRVRQRIRRLSPREMQRDSPAK